MESTNIAVLATGSGMCPGLELLGQAWICARDVNCAAREFAVEVESLLRSGMTATELRWLVAKGYAEHVRETTRSSHARRRFRGGGGLAFSARSCLVLTETGYAALAQAGESTGNCAADAVQTARLPGDRSRSRGGGEAVTGNYTDGPSALPRASESDTRGARTLRPLPLPGGSGIYPLPVWDAARRELRLGARVIKRFKRTAATQELILTAFQEDGWPPVIDDPLPIDLHQDPRRRLHYAVFRINRGQRPRLIRFSVEGTGQSIRWELLCERRAKRARKARLRR